MLNVEDSIIEMALRVLEDRLKRTTFEFTSPDAVKQYVRLHLQGKEREYFGVLLLNNQNQLLVFEIIHSGTFNVVNIYPREVARLALLHNAAAVIFVHNHPSGSTEASRADIQMTAKLRSALALFDIRTLDHLIVAGNVVVSMAEEGLI